jgi:hypothetical protein
VLTPRFLFSVEQLMHGVFGDRHALALQGGVKFLDAEESGRVAQEMPDQPSQAGHVADPLGQGLSERLRQGIRHGVIFSFVEGEFSRDFSFWEGESLI